MPATNASSEHAFSALRRVKSYCRTTMSNNRLNHLMTCTVHTELVKELSLKQVPNDSVDRVEKRSSIFMTCTVHKELMKELNLKLVTNAFVDREEKRSSGHFFPHSSNRCG